MKETEHDDVFTLATDSVNRLASSNPVYVEPGSIFTINLVSLNPGWIHFDKTFAPKSLESGKWNRHEAEHIRGKELWLLFTITSLDNDDPLELKRKQYFHATSVKFGSESFRGVPLDIDEKRVFSHEADSAYRVDYKVYEVDHFNLKRAAVDAFNNNPGISGLGLTFYQSVKSTLGSILGDSLLKLGGSEDDDKLVLERLLLSQGAEIELFGSFLILRSEGQMEEEQGVVAERTLTGPRPHQSPEIEAMMASPLGGAGEPVKAPTTELVDLYATFSAKLPANLLTQDYLLFDYFKSFTDPVPEFRKEDGEKYLTVQQSVEDELGELDIHENGDASFIRISVSQAKKLEDADAIDKLNSLAEDGYCSDRPARPDASDDQKKRDALDCASLSAAARKVQAYLAQTLD